MAYPEPVPVLKAKDAREFEKRLRCFKLSAAQRQFYRQAREIFGEKE